MFSNRWMNKQCVVDSHSKLLLSNKKEWTIDTHNGKNKSQKTIMLSENRCLRTYSMLPFIRNSRKYSFIYSKKETLSVVAWEPELGLEIDRKSEKGNLWRGSKYSVWTVVVLSQVYTSFKAHQIVNYKWMKIILRKFIYLNKVQQKTRK